MIARRMQSVAAGGALVVMACLIPPRAEAQTIARRVADARDGKVRMTFAARPDLCGFANGISTKSSNRTNNRSWNDNESDDVIYDGECSEGPVRLVATVRNGRVSRISANLGGRWRPASGGVTDIGNVSTRDAVEFLIALASSGSGNAASEAIFATTLADSTDLTRTLSPIAENESLSEDVRGQAVFWLGQGKSPGISEYLDKLYTRTGNSDVKDKIIFALSQRRESAALDKLMDIARHDPDRDMRKKAMFWLGQSRDPRVTAFLTDIITR
jgi:HEAT repeats